MGIPAWVQSCAEVLECSGQRHCWDRVVLAGMSQASQGDTADLGDTGGTHGAFIASRVGAPCVDLLGAVEFDTAETSLEQGREFRHQLQPQISP